MRKTFITILAASALLSGCKPVDPTVGPTVKDIQAEKAEAAADQISYTDNSEINNISRRLKLTSNPGTIGFVLLMNQMGQPVMYTSVKGKITSSGKRLTPPIRDWGRVGSTKNYVVQGTFEVAPSDEGTWGSSDPYIYFWTQEGQYIQWNGPYLYSDKPFRTRIEPVVLDIKG